MMRSSLPPRSPVLPLIELRLLHREPKPSLGEHDHLFSRGLGSILPPSVSLVGRTRATAASLLATFLRCAPFDSLKADEDAAHL
jgi:hypothetical protein